ncbi:DUF4190 domain-containing protein [Planctomycetaceae bacterium SH139]
MSNFPPSGPNDPNPYAASGPLAQQPNFGQQAGYGQQAVHPDQQGDATGGLIPYKNPKALIAYYVGILGLLPIIGLPLSLAAVVLGILGLKARKQNPIIKGSVHAWIGIVLGMVATLYNTLFVVAIVAAMASSR